MGQQITNVQAQQITNVQAHVATQQKQSRWQRWLQDSEVKPQQVQVLEITEVQSHKAP